MHAHKKPTQTNDAIMITMNARTRVKYSYVNKTKTNDNSLRNWRISYTPTTYAQRQRIRYADVCVAVPRTDIRNANPECVSNSSPWRLGEPTLGKLIFGKTTFGSTRHCLWQADLCHDAIAFVHNFMALS